jgi:hypothetical protein
VLREYHDTAAEHQQTDYLEQHQKVIFIGHGSDEAIRVPEVAFDVGVPKLLRGLCRLLVPHGDCPTEAPVKVGAAATAPHRNGQ